MADPDRIPRVTYPYVSFEGAYMAPVPEVAATSAITIGNQIPAALLRNIPGNQQQAYIDQWALLNDSERLLVLQTYGTGYETPAEVQQAPRMVLAMPPEAIPADLLARVPEADRGAYAEQWPMLSEGERQVV